MPAATTAVKAHGGDGAAMSVAAARRALTEQFRAAGLDTPELDARVLLGHALALDHAGFAAEAARLLQGREGEAIAALARRRLMHEPVARIVGRREFWSLTLRIDATTLVPRPETETLIEAALAELDKRDARQRPLRIADFGTGSGALLLALLRELSNARGVGTDTSIGALRVARDNARDHGAAATFVACDLGAALAPPFDLIVCNPPYIPTGDIAALAPEVRDFDPRPALDGGADGLDAYRALAATVPPLLKVGGALVVELGIGQASAVASLFTAAGLAPLPPRPDLDGIPRALVAKR